jgi:hypothetical protein
MISHHHHHAPVQPHHNHNPPPASSSASSAFRNYPFLTGEEFAEACHHLDRRYCKATLGPLRRRWRLRVCRALNTGVAGPGGGGFVLGPEYSTYLQIVRPLMEGGADGCGRGEEEELARCLDGLSVGDGGGDRDGGPGPGRVGMEMEIDDGVGDGDGEMVRAEEADREQVRSVCVHLYGFGFGRDAIAVFFACKRPCLMILIQFSDGRAQRRPRPGRPCDRGRGQVRDTPPPDIPGALPVVQPT